MLIKAREEGFKEAMEIFGSNVPANVTSNDIEVETHKRHRRKRRDIRQIIIKELSYSAKAMTTQQIAKAIDYLLERTEAALKRLESEGKIIRNRDGLWEVVVITGASPDSLTPRGLITKHLDQGSVASVSLRGSEARPVR
jgi:hypothetical protein